MIQRVINGKIFGFGSGEEVIITGNEDRKRQILGLQCLTGHQGSCQLNSIVTTQAVDLSQIDGAADDLSVHWKEEEVFITILEEAAKGPIHLLLGDAPRRAVFGRQSSGHLCQSDLGEENSVLNMEVGDLADPAASGFVSVALYEGTSVEVVVGQGLGPRCSRMISLMEGPAA